MEVIATCAGLASLLPKLAPLAGGALAINVAYLNLARFRYRKNIREFAYDQLARLQQEPKPDLPKHIVETKWYKQVARLGALSDNGTEIRKSTRLPPGAWGKVFNFMFEFHQDKIVSFILTAVAVFGLVIGSAHSIDHLIFFRVCSVLIGSIIHSIYLFFHCSPQ